MHELYTLSVLNLLENPQGRPQIVGYGIAERLELAVLALQLLHHVLQILVLPRELGVEAAIRLAGALDADKMTHAGAQFFD